MRKLFFTVFAVFLLAVPVLAADEEAGLPTDFGAQALEEALDSETREALLDVSPTSGGDFGKTLLNILKTALTRAQSGFRAAILAGGKVLAAGILCGFAANTQESGTKLPAILAGAFAITALCTKDVHGAIGLARETVQKISDLTTLLLPVLSASLAASGGSVSAGALLSGGMLAMSALTRLASSLLIPLVYVYILLCAAESACESAGLGKVRELVGWTLPLLIKGVCAAFTAYLSLTRILSAPADAAAVKAAQAAFSGMVPVVGSILSDASESLLAGAGLIRSSVGLFGMLAVLAIAAAPFLQLAAYYLVLKVAGAVSVDAVCPTHAALLSHLSAAMGYMLAIAASAIWMGLISAACFLQAVVH
mgnify:CR=1 FL=1